MQSLGLIVVLALINFTHIILAITLYLGRTFTRKIVLCYIKNRSESTSFEKYFQGLKLFECFSNGNVLDKSCCDRFICSISFFKT